jgi:hypothetical protein
MDKHVYVTGNEVVIVPVITRGLEWVVRIGLERPIAMYFYNTDELIELLQVEHKAKFLHRIRVIGCFGNKCRVSALDAIYGVIHYSFPHAKLNYVSINDHTITINGPRTSVFRWIVRNIPFAGGCIIIAIIVSLFGWMCRKVW